MAQLRRRNFNSASLPLAAEVLEVRALLTGPQGQAIHSDHGRIGIHLSPGTYTLSVSAEAGLGAYRLTTTFTPG